MSRWIDGRPRYWYGWTDIGPIQIPPVPRYIILTDRADGTKWWVTYNTDLVTADGYGYISITTDSPPSSQESITYSAYDEPYVADNDLTTLRQLIIRSGYLGVDETNLAHITSAGNMVLYARKSGLNIPMRRIIFSTTGQFYAWEPFTITQTANPV